LNPDFAIFDIEVKDDAENPPLVPPANVGELVVIIFGVTDDCRFYIIRIGIRIGLLI
jgi:hypothetical protein